MKNNNWKKGSRVLFGDGKKALSNFYRTCLIIYPDSIQVSLSFHSVLLLFFLIFLFLNHPLWLIITLNSLYILGSSFPLEIVYNKADCPCLKQGTPCPSLLLSVSLYLFISDISWRLTLRLERLLDKLVICLQSMDALLAARTPTYLLTIILFALFYYHTIGKVQCNQWF